MAKSATSKELTPVLAKCIRKSPVHAASFYWHGYTTSVEAADGEYVVRTYNSMRVIFHKSCATLADAAYACECNEYQGGAPDGWTAVR